MESMKQASLLASPKCTHFNTEQTKWKNTTQSSKQTLAVAHVCNNSNRDMNMIWREKRSRERTEAYPDILDAESPECSPTRPALVPERLLSLDSPHSTTSH